MTVDDFNELRKYVEPIMKAVPVVPELAKDTGHDFSDPEVMHQVVEETVHVLIATGYTTVDKIKEEASTPEEFRELVFTCASFISVLSILPLPIQLKVKAESAMHNEPMVRRPTEEFRKEIKR